MNLLVIKDEIRSLERNVEVDFLLTYIGNNGIYVGYEMYSNFFIQIVLLEEKKITQNFCSKIEVGQVQGK